jgi:hypothetical protein
LLSLVFVACYTQNPAIYVKLLNHGKTHGPETEVPASREKGSFEEKEIKETSGSGKSTDRIKRTRRRTAKREAKQEKENAG